MDPPELQIRKGKKGVCRIIITDSNFLEVQTEEDGPRKGETMLIPMSNVRHVCIG